MRRNMCHRSSQIRRSRLFGQGRSLDRGEQAAHVADRNPQAADHAARKGTLITVGEKGDGVRF
jgi:hypothetical protein